MSWLYSQALVEEYLGENSLDGAQCALWNGTHTQQASWLHGKTTDACRLSRSGMMYKHLTDDLGKELLKWFREAFLAKTLAQPEKEPESTESEAECGSTWLVSLAKYDRDTHLWKTAQCSLLEGLDEFSETWPKWGMMRDGVLLVADTPIALCEETESGYLPAVVASDGTHHGKEKWIANSRAKRKASGKSPPTEKITYAYYEAGIPMKYFPEISEDVMNWPIGWTDLEPLATDKFRQWLRSHGEF